MWVIFLEAGLALVLLFIIVWATWPKRGRGAEASPDNPEEAKDE